MSISRSSLLSFAISSTLGVSAAALAQEAPRESGLEEIIVTAERRAESLQDVPLSITAYGDEFRDQVGILSIRDMANFAPGVSYNTATDRPSIRGIARQSNAFSLDSPVANYIDGVYTSSVQDAQRRPIFIERTEILRGPQGALSGRGSIAGAFNTISKRPEEDFNGEVRAFGGDFESYGAETTLTGALASWMRSRVNLGVYRQNEGYYENLATKRTEGDQPNNRSIADFLFEFDLGDSVDWFVKASFSDYDESYRNGYRAAPFVSGVLNAPAPWVANSNALVPFPTYGLYAGGGVDLRPGADNTNPALRDERQFVSDLQSRQTLDNHHSYISHLTWNAPVMEVKWIGGHQKYTYTQWTETADDNADVVSVSLPGRPGGPIYPGGRNLYFEEREWYSNELTFTSTTEGAFNWIVGLYQSNEEYTQQPQSTFYSGYPELNRPIGSVDRLLQLIGAPHNPALARSVAANPVAGRAQFGQLEGETISQAIFGQADFSFTDQWKLTLGVRYNEDEKEVLESARYIANSLGSQLAPILAGGGIPALGPTAVDVSPAYDPNAPLPEGVVADYGYDPVTGYRKRKHEDTWDAFTGSVGIDFTPTDNDLIFMRAARGYRPGGFNAGFFINPPRVDKESVDSFEVGYKTTLFDRLQLNTSVFYYDYRDIQLPLPTLGRCTDPNNLSTCTSLNSFVNLPKGETKGVEIEANWAATDSLSFYLSYGYLDASIKDGLPAGSNGFTNPEDPAAVFANANRYRAIPGQFDSGFTFMQRYTQDLSGNSLSYSPKHRAAFNTNYTFRMSPGDLTFSASYVWRDKQFTDVFESPVGELDSFGTVGLRIIWKDADDRYSVILYGTNLTDELETDGASYTRIRTGLASASNPNPAGQGVYLNPGLAPPRNYGLELQYRFGN